MILAKAKGLPVFLTGREARDEEIWEGNEAGVHFKLTKEAIALISDSPIILMLSVSGPEASRKKIISDFIDVLGNPQNQFTLHEVPGVYYVAWHADF